MSLVVNIVNSRFATGGWGGGIVGGRGGGNMARQCSAVFRSVGDNSMVRLDEEG